MSSHGSYFAEEWCHGAKPTDNQMSLLNILKKAATNAAPDASARPSDTSAGVNTVVDQSSLTDLPYQNTPNELFSFKNALVNYSGTEVESLVRNLYSDEVQTRAQALLQRKVQWVQDIGSDGSCHHFHYPGPCALC